MSTPGGDPAERLRSLYRAFNDRDIEPVEVAVEPDGRVVVLVDQIVRDLDGGVVACGRVVHAYRLSGGLVTEMEIRAPAA
jgi:hypothetical protein